MQIDGLILSKIVVELKKTLVNQRVKKIFMPSEGRFYFTFFHLTFLVSLIPDSSYIQIVPIKEESPFFPPAFVMLLRKHLKGALCTDIQQLGLDRTIKIEFKNLSEEGEPKTFNILIELMGRNSNLIFCNEKLEILDSCHRKANLERSLMPNTLFKPFSKEALRIDTWDMLQGKEILQHAISQFPADTFAIRFIEKAFEGVGRLASTEALYRSGIDPEAPILSISQDKIENLNLVLSTLRKEMQESDELYIWECEDSESLISATDMKSLQDRGFRFLFKPPSEAIEDVFSLSRKKFDVKRFKERFSKLIDKEIKKVESNLFNMQTDISETKDFELYQKQGQYIFANVYQYPSNEKRQEIVVEDWETGKKFTIPLDPKITLSSNAQHLFKKSAKLKRRSEVLTERIKMYQAMLYYLEQVQQNLFDAEDMESVQEIVTELKEEGWLKEKGKAKRKKEVSKAKPSEFRIFEKSGFKILVGKNNLQNDKLVKESRAGDVWFHTQGTPGSHVILKNNQKAIPEDVLFFAAQLAARYSKAFQSSSVPVDYSDVKNIHKPKGFKPGMVLYKEYKTLYVDPYPIPLNPQ